MGYEILIWRVTVNDVEDIILRCPGVLRWMLFRSTDARQHFKRKSGLEMKGFGFVVFFRQAGSDCRQYLRTTVTPVSMLSSS